MNMTKAALLTHLDYSIWANQRLIEACSALSQEELTRDLCVSHEGVTGTLRHIYYAERVWLNRLLARQQTFQDPAPEPGLAELKRKWPEVWAGFRQWLERLPDAELETELHSRRLNGDEFRLARWKVLLHVVNHSTLHRGQVMGMLRQLGKQPPATDIFNFYLQAAATTRV
jgi:uncharacterized damage-inducible protein DinB